MKRFTAAALGAALLVAPLMAYAETKPAPDDTQQLRDQIKRLEDELAKLQKELSQKVPINPWQADPNAVRPPENYFFTPPIKPPTTMPYYLRVAPRPNGSDQVPKRDWKPFQYNGQTYYIIPIHENPAAASQIQP